MITILCIVIVNNVDNLKQNRVFIVLSILVVLLLTDFLERTTIYTHLKLLLIIILI